MRNRLSAHQGEAQNTRLRCPQKAQDAFYGPPCPLLGRGQDEIQDAQKPSRGYREFSEAFEDKLYKARVDAGEFVRDNTFEKSKQEMRKKYKEKRRRYLEETAWQYELFDKMLGELKKENVLLFLKLHSNGASKPMLVLDKYFVEGRRVTAVMGEQA